MYIRKFRKEKVQLPKQVGNIVKRHFVANFRKQGFDDNGVTPWRPRKRRDSGRAILVKSGKLRKSIRVKQAKFSAIRVGTYSLPYSRRHNRGLKGMPQRQFIGPSNNMTSKIRKHIHREVKKIFKR